MGLEEVLVTELEQLGATDITPLKRAVKFSGDLRLLYACNLRLRTALNVLVPIAEFEARDEHELYNAIRTIDWSQYMDVSDTFAINPTVNSTSFRHSKYVALKSKDAIVDWFMDRERRRPSIDVKHPDFKIDIRVYERSFTVSLDSSGAPLHMRGYRMGRHPAAINEVLAAGLIQLSGWKGETPLIDPFCGSGTLLIEAAMIAQNVAPNLNRKAFAFKNWKSFDKALWVDVRMDAIENQREVYPELVGIDKEQRAIDAARLNFNTAPVEEKNISFLKGDFATYEPPFERGTVITNPPYGERLNEQDTQELYTTLGNRFKNHFQGFNAWVISTPESLKHLGLHPTPKYHVMNGPIVCKFQRYEIYPGSKKA